MGLGQWVVGLASQVQWRRMQGVRQQEERTRGRESARLGERCVAEMDEEHVMC